MHHPTLHELVCCAMKSKKKEQHSSYIDEQQQPTITSTLKKVQKYDKQTKKKWCDITNAVMFCLSKDSLPIYTVAKLGFYNLLEKIDPQYDQPSNKYFSYEET